MAITNAQQFRQMFRYGGDTMGGPNDKSNAGQGSGSQGPAGGASSGGNYGGNQNPNQSYGGGDAREDYRSQQYTNTNIKTPTVTRSEDTFTPTFAPKQKKGLGIIDLGLMLATGGLFGTKAKTAAQLLGTAKRTKNLVSDLSNTFNFKNPLADIFSNKPKTKSPTTNTIDRTGDGEGLASLENANALQEEYLLLLQKLQTGLISDEEQVRYTMLKNMLGI
jgi:hypothetical protein